MSNTPRDASTEISLSIPLGFVNVVLTALQTRPLAEALGPFQAIQQQTATQLEALDAKDQATAKALKIVTAQQVSVPRKKRSISLTPPPGLAAQDGGVL